MRTKTEYAAHKTMLPTNKALSVASIKSGGMEITMLDKLLNKIKEADKIAIFNHEHPDGDAMGSAYALKLMLIGMGKRAEVFLRDGDTQTREFSFMKGKEPCGLKIGECDLKIAVDCADLERLGSFARQLYGNTAAIDHHATHAAYSDTRVVDADAAATGEIIYDIIVALGAELTRDIANNLYVALACDTGSFKYSCTTAKTHTVAAELIKTGIDFAGISRRLFDTNSIEYLKAYKSGIERLELYSEGRIALLAFSDSDFAEIGIDERDADGLTNLPKSVEGVRVGVYIRERGRGYKVSLRSNDETDVAEIAMSFGGGGHVKASGFSLNMPLDEVKKTVVAAIDEAFKGADSE